MRQAQIFFRNILAGILTEDETGYSFLYNKEYLVQENAEPVSLILPLSEEVYRSNILFPFFDGLIPEGWLLEIAEQNWKLNLRDRFSLLLACCKDCIGAVSVVEL
jgi:serine/threonine-protein kinase HipA